MDVLPYGSGLAVALSPAGTRVASLHPVDPMTGVILTSRLGRCSTRSRRPTAGWASSSATYPRAGLPSPRPRRRHCEPWPTSPRSTSPSWTWPCRDRRWLRRTRSPAASGPGLSRARPDGRGRSTHPWPTRTRSWLGLRRGRTHADRHHRRDGHFRVDWSTGTRTFDASSAVLGHGGSYVVRTSVPGATSTTTVEDSRTAAVRATFADTADHVVDGDWVWSKDTKTGGLLAGRNLVTGTATPAARTARSTA